MDTLTFLEVRFRRLSSEIDPRVNTTDMKPQLKQLEDWKLSSLTN